MLLEGALGTLDGGDMLGVLDDLGHGLLVLRALDELVQTSVLGSQDKEGDAKERIGTRGEDGDLALVALDGLAILVAQGKVDLGALGAADPVGLHLLDALGPAGELLQVVEQLLRVIGNLVVHCSRSRFSGSVPQRQHLPSVTCSLARTVLQVGHQLTGFFLR